jgi:hypothetical protein
LGRGAPLPQKFGKFGKFGKFKKYAAPQQVPTSSMKSLPAAASYGVSRSINRSVLDYRRLPSRTA